MPGKRKLLQHLARISRLRKPKTLSRKSSVASADAISTHSKSPSAMSVESLSSPGISQVKNQPSFASCCVEFCQVTETSFKPDGRIYTLFDPPPDKASRLRWALYVPAIDCPVSVTDISNCKVCELHFVDGRPTKENPWPTQNLRLLPVKSQEYKNMTSKSKEILFNPPPPLIVIKKVLENDDVTNNQLPVNSDRERPNKRSFNSMNEFTSANVSASRTPLTAPIGVVTRKQRETEKRKRLVSNGGAEEACNPSGNRQNLENLSRQNTTESENYEQNMRGPPQLTPHIQKIGEIAMNESEEQVGRRSTDEVVNANDASNVDSSLKIKLPSQKTKKRSISPSALKRGKFLNAKMPYMSPEAALVQKPENPNMLRPKATAEVIRPSTAVPNITIGSNSSARTAAENGFLLRDTPRLMSDVVVNSQESFPSYVAKGKRTNDRPVVSSTEPCNHCGSEINDLRRELRRDLARVDCGSEINDLRRELRRDLARVENKVDTMFSLVRSFLQRTSTTAWRAGQSAPSANTSDLDVYGQVTAPVPPKPSATVNLDESQGHLEQASSKICKPVGNEQRKVIKKIMGGKMMQCFVPGTGNSNSSSLLLNNKNNSEEISMVSITSDEIGDKSSPEEFAMDETGTISVDESANMLLKGPKSISAPPLPIHEPASVLPAGESGSKASKSRGSCKIRSVKITGKSVSCSTSFTFNEENGIFTCNMPETIIKTCSNVTETAEQPTKTSDSVESNDKNESSAKANDSFDSNSFTFNEKTGTFACNFPETNISSTEIEQSAKANDSAEAHSSVDIPLHVEIDTSAEKIDNRAEKSDNQPEKIDNQAEKVDNRAETAPVSDEKNIEKQEKSVFGEPEKEKEHENPAGKSTELTETPTRLSALTPKEKLSLIEQASMNPKVVIKKYCPDKVVNHAVARAVLLFAGRALTVDHVKEYGPTWLSGIPNEEIETVVQCLTEQELLKLVGMRQVHWPNKGKVVMAIYQKLSPKEVQEKKLTSYGVTMSAYLSSYSQPPSKYTLPINKLCGFTSK